MTHEEKIARWIGHGKVGTEIGPGSAPLPGFGPRPIYVDHFATFGNVPVQADYYGHACSLPFHDHSLDYVLASHVLEHVANPVAALAEWYRVVRPGGIIYLVVPNRRATWEHRRELTSVDHLFEDFMRGTTAVDPTHIEEFVFQADWSLYSPETPPADVPGKQAELARTMKWAVANGEEINIHFHTFEASSLREFLVRLHRGGKTPGRREDAGKGLRDEAAAPALPRLNWEIVDFADGFPKHCPNGILAVLRVDKGWHARAHAELFRLATAGNPKAMLRDDARPFAEWAAAAGKSSPVIGSGND